MIHHMWRLSEAGPDNLGLACTDNGLLLGGTPLIERRDAYFVVRNRDEIERLLRSAYQRAGAADRIMPGLSVVARALNANDQCLARIAAVHLKIPDLPSFAARDALETEDRLIKYAAGDWDPAKHPRAGTPPNPGWFAPTDGVDEQREGRVRFAENESSTRRSDAAQSIGENRIVLSPGRRNDELDDLLEWIANANPKDEQAIRGEIKRRYYDAGDFAGGNALSAALGNALALGSGILPKDRQQILAALGPQSHEDEETTESLIDAGLLLLGVLPPISAAEAPALVWRLGWAARGKYLEDLFGRTLVQNFPVVDKFGDGLSSA